MKPWLAMDDAHERLKEARAAFDAADLLPEAWRRANPEPTGCRALKRWERREHEYRYSVTMPQWQEVIAAEREFSAAQMAVAKIDARDMGELALKACLSGVYDRVHLARGHSAVIGFSVALNFVGLRCGHEPTQREGVTATAGTKGAISKKARTIAKDRPLLSHFHYSGRSLPGDRPPPEAGPRRN
jgi:hypothetical protein